MKNNEKPNVVYILTDQWRTKATGYNGDPNAITPAEGNFRHRFAQGEWGNYRSTTIGEATIRPR